MNSAAHVAVVDAVVEREHFHARREQPFAPSAPVTRHMIGGNESARLLDLRLLLRLKDRAVRARNRNCVLPQDCAGQSENKRNRTPAAELDFGSEANHAISDYQTVFAAVPTVKQNQPPMPLPLNNQLSTVCHSSFVLRAILARSAVRRRSARVSEAVSPANNATFPIGSIVVQRVAKSLLILIRSGDICRSVCFILIRMTYQARAKLLRATSHDRTRE